MAIAPQYAGKVKLEYEWLPKLAKNISLKIPKAATSWAVFSCLSI